MGDADIEMLIKECRSSEPTTQVNAIQRLLELDAYLSIPALVEMLKSPDPVVRCTAAQALGQLGTKDPGTAGAALLDMLADSEVIVRSEAVDVLGILRYVPAVEPVRSLLLYDPEPLVRASAAETDRKSVV